MTDKYLKKIVSRPVFSLLCSLVKHALSATHARYVSDGLTVNISLKEQFRNERFQYSKFLPLQLPKSLSEYSEHSSWCWERWTERPEMFCDLMIPLPRVRTKESENRTRGSYLSLWIPETKLNVNEYAILLLHPSAFIDAFHKGCVVISPRPKREANWPTHLPSVHDC